MSKLKVQMKSKSQMTKFYHKFELFLIVEELLISP
jgi:hypothetical protein